MSETAGHDIAKAEQRRWRRAAPRSGAALIEKYLMAIRQCLCFVADHVR